MKISVRFRWAFLACVLLSACVASSPSSKSVASSPSSKSVVWSPSSKSVPVSKKEQRSQRVALQKEFPQSAVLAYNAVETHLANGQRQKALDLHRRSKAKFPDFPHWERQALNFASVEELIAAFVNERLRIHLAGADDAVSFTAQEPVKRKAPPLPTLVKGEFEKTVDFKARVARAQSERKALMQKIEDDYRRDLNAYNRAVEGYNRALQAEIDRRNRQVPAKRLEFLQLAVNRFYGVPKLTRLDYDADAETFNAEIVGSKDVFSRDLQIYVPIEEAPAFKEEYLNGTPDVTFAFKGESLVMEGVATGAGKRYAVNFGAGGSTAPVRVTLSEAKVAVNRIDRLTVDSGKRSDESQYFIDALNLEDNPELAKVKQREAEIARQKEEALLARRQQEELTKRKEQLALAELELAKLRGDDSYKGLQEKTKWRFAKAKRAKRNLIAVVVGNRQYEEGIPPVHYALNDAKAMRRFLEESLQVEPSNILYKENATKGHLEALFESELPNRVAAAGGDAEVFVYFSGHGFPDRSNAVLLPSDALPGTATVSGYSRDRLLNKLAALDAKSLTVALDACFTGTAKNGKGILKNAKAQFRAPKSPAIPDNMTLISSGQADQVSWGNDDLGHSVMTYFLLKALNGEADGDGNGSVEPAELESFLTREVNSFTLKNHNRSQVPEIAVGGNGESFVF